MRNVIRLFFFSLLAGIILLVSCKKDDKNETAIVGKWYLVKADFNEHRNGQDNRYSENFSGEDYLQLNADGTLVEFMDDDELPGKWSRSRNKLHLMYGSFYGDYEMTIQTLNDTSLIFYYKEDIVEGEYDEEIYHYNR